MEELYHNERILSSFLLFRLNKAQNKGCKAEITAKRLTKTVKKCRVNSEN